LAGCCTSGEWLNLTNGHFTLNQATYWYLAKSLH
jgi:hypothetical protein